MPDRPPPWLYIVRMTPLSRHTIRLLAALALTACTLAAPAVASAATPRCLTSSLRLDFVRGQGFTSHRAWDFALRNTGSATCQLRGYPGVALLDRHARVEGPSVVRRGAPVQTVVLAPWRRAFFTFVFTVAGPCPSGVRASGLQVFPPNARRALRWHQRFDVCAGSHPDVTPVRSKLGG
jgi:hypothetical protein